MKYKDEKELRSVLSKFENVSIERGTWGHPEHLVVAYFYSIENDYETALSKMRSGIFNLLKAFEVDLSKEMPYHETLTVFWMKTVFEFARNRNGCSIVESCTEMIETFDKDYPSRFYTREHLFSDEARSSYVEGDLRNS